jgi:hypothetical protein
MPAPIQAFRYLAEHPDNPFRLGRHQVHDALVAELEAVVDLQDPVRSVSHQEFLPVFDQGNLGSCTANAALGTLVTDPFGKPGVAFTETDAVQLYREETRLDDSQIPGHYEPDDTGSTGAWSMMALQRRGLIRTWHHTRKASVALRLLNKGSFSFGTPWFPSMFAPDANGRLLVNTSVEAVGGHQICVVANDTSSNLIKIRNSWGPSWGQDGHCFLRWDDFATLLKLGGDVVQPVL